MTDYIAVLEANYPGAQWSLSGNDYDTLVWHDDTPKPSQAELDAAWPAVQQAQAQAEVDAQRHAAYTAESDPLFFQWQRGEGTEQAWLDKIAEIQARFPDPQ
ncbi:MAG: hypothetical protein ACO3O3_06955 [Ilumatobacteraceae bacterium]